MPRPTRPLQVGDTYTEKGETWTVLSVYDAAADENETDAVSAKKPYDTKICDESFDIDAVSTLSSKTRAVRIERGGGRYPPFDPSYTFRTTGGS